MIETLVSFVLATAALALSPGPDNIFVLSQSIVHGKKYGLATVLGLMTGCIVHSSLIAFGVSAIIIGLPQLFYGIKLFGAFYLLYLAYKVYSSSSEINLNSEDLEKKSPIKLIRVGFLMNVLNPKVAIFFLAFFPKFLFSEELSSVLQFYILGGLFILTSGTIFSTISIFGGFFSKQLKELKNIGVFFKWLQIIVFVGIAFFILV